MGQHVLDQVNDSPPHTGCATAKRQHFQAHHQINHRAGHGVTHATAMRKDEISLQYFRILRGDLDGCEFAKAGVDARDGFVSGSGTGDHGGGGIDARAA
jgi:hypothetical protein